MDNRTKDLIGYLRAVNLLLLLASLDAMRFPLDAELSRSISRFRPRLEKLMEAVYSVACLEALRAEFLSAIDDIVADDTAPWYDREMTQMLLNLFLGREERFPMDDIIAFRAALVPVLDRKLEELIGASLWERLDCLEFHARRGNTGGSATCSEGQSQIGDMLTAIAELVAEAFPGNPQARPAYLVKYLERWLTAVRARSSLDSPMVNPLGLAVVSAVVENLVSTLNPGTEGRDGAEKGDLHR